MKFHFKNLGTIKKTTLDLRPLTVIVGPNNTSKTYLAYCVHGMIRAIGSQQWEMMAGEPGARFTESDLFARARKQLKHISTKFIKELPQYFQDTFGGLFKNTSVSIDFDDDELKSAIPRLVAQYPEYVDNFGNEITCRFYYREQTDATGPLAILLVAEVARESLALPAERNAFILSYKMLATRRYRLLRDRERSFFGRTSAGASRPGTGREIPIQETGHQSYPVPIEDFLDFLTDVELEGAGHKNNNKSSFGKLADVIESQIHGGHRTVYQSTPAGGRKLMLEIRDDFRIDLYNASSSIKQLAPLLLYLRYRAAPNQVLIIDEPEMNLHPEAQAKLLEALGMLANLGVHVLLTTHSPYFMAHLNNLIAADQKSSARKKRQAKHLYMGNPAAFLSPSDVSAYEMRPEGLVSLADSEYGIRWDTLSDVSAELQRRHFAIVEEPAGRGKAKA
ncbi:MAG TPA: ATP-binding protein [Polyangium sp.]|nr:ATP-binding protein [Polyangium sp.]